MDYSVLDGQLSTKISYSVEDTQNCPDLQATVWFETPEGADVEDQTKIDDSETIAQAAGGTISNTFVQAPIKGEYYAHVTVVPFGFECAMAIDETCTELAVNLPCEAKITYF